LIELDKPEMSCTPKQSSPKAFGGVLVKAWNRGSPQQDGEELSICIKGDQEIDMSRRRFRVVFTLLVLILVAASILFGLLTYWLSAGGF
jgi:hypothetical protein